jgi:hypothetical protein
MQHYSFLYVSLHILRSCSKVRVIILYSILTITDVHISNPVKNATISGDIYLKCSRLY